MEAVTHHHHFHLSLNHRRPSFPRPIAAVRSIQQPPSFRRLSVRASSSSSSSRNPSSKPSSLVKTTCAAIAAAAFFLARFDRGSGAAVAAPVATPEAAETEAEESRDVEELRSLMEEKIKGNKLDEALGVLDRLIELEPEELEWPLLKANLHSFTGEHELAVAEFEEILKKDPFRVEAYHGLVMAGSESSNGDPEKMKGLVGRVEAAMKGCKNKSDVRDFKLLIAQITLMESDYDGALKLYEELVKEEPRDFRPYLCQGIIYTLLSKQSEAQKQFDTFRRLVPKNHPYREYFEDNMFATKLFSQAGREASSRRTT